MMNTQIRSLSHHRRVLTAAGYPWYDPDNEGLTPHAAYQPKGAFTYAASLENLISPGTHDAGEGTAPAWDAVNGWKFNGSSHYLTTDFTVQVDQSQTVLVQFSNLTNTDTLFGFYRADTTDGLIIRGDNGSNAVVYRHGAATVAQSAKLLAGNLAIAGNQGYRNGSADGGTIGAFAGASVLQPTIGALVNTGGVANFAAVYIQALAIFSTTLTSTQVLAIATAMAAL
jgi:hypothetical protein